MNYVRIYNQIIEKAKSENRTKKTKIYYEAHHIIPKCLGGEGEYFQWNNHSNIILLTPKEHFLCHQLLCEIYPNNDKLKYALWSMCNKSSSKNRNYKISSRLYERIKIYQSEIHRQNRIGKKHSEETKQKISKANRGKKQTEEHKQKRLNKITGIKRNSITKEKMSTSASKPKPHLQKIILQFSIEGNFIKEWGCAKYAAISLGKKSSGNICECCKGKRKQAYGYIWKFKEN
jgi:hypothetical protein